MSLRKSSWTVLLIVLAAAAGARAQASPAGIARKHPQPSGLPRAEDLRIAVASDLSVVLPELAARFEKQTGHRVSLSFGSSGNFFAQIENGAPFDLFFSADVEFPRRLEAAGLAEPGTLFLYATGKVVLWVRQDSHADLGLGLAVLLDPAIRKIAIANPRHAPYGRAAVAAMQRAGLYAQVQAKLVFGENVSQAAQFVESGNADIGILAMSLAIAPAMKSRGRYAEVPASDDAPMGQACVVLRASPRKQAALQFLEYVKTAEAAALFASHGFAPGGRK